MICFVPLLFYCNFIPINLLLYHYEYQHGLAGIYFLITQYIPKVEFITMKNFGFTNMGCNLKKGTLQHDPRFTVLDEWCVWTDSTDVIERLIRKIQCDLKFNDMFKKGSNDFPHSYYNPLFSFPFLSFLV